MLTFYFQVLGALILDLVMGDPRYLPHPVRGIGWLCEKSEAYCRNLIGIYSLRLCGSLAFFMVLLSTFGLVTTYLLLLRYLHFAALVVGSILLLYFSIATGDLIVHSKRVIAELKRGDLPAARQAVALMVGRDTNEMRQDEISRACVESVAENFVDGVTAPLFWAYAASFLAAYVQFPAIACAAGGAMLYKAINTMDSIYGYKNDRYLEFGWLAAKIDDIANFLPARISGLTLVAAAYLLKFDGSMALKIFSQDRLKSSSPNSGHPEAAVAGALRVQLGGEACYFGKLIGKPLIGQGFSLPNTGDIERCNRLILFATFLFYLSASFVHQFITRLV